MTRTTKPAPKEIDIQSGFKSKLRYIAPAVRMIAIPNGMFTTMWAARRAKREGMVSGVPDVTCLWRGGQCWIEFKTANGAVSNNQAEWIDWLNANGHDAAVCRTIEEAYDFLRHCGAPVIGRISA